MDCKLMPEFCYAMIVANNSLYYKIGFWGIVILLLFGVILYFIIKKNIESEVEKDRIKNIELWKQQKELMFDFVKFLEEDFFNNSKLGSEDERKEVFKKLNKYYGQLYLIMEADIIETINKYFTGALSVVQRFYLYKELRKQLMSVINNKTSSDKDCPYVIGDPTQVKVFTKEGEQLLAVNIDDVKKAYPFIEELDDGNYKTLPFYAESKNTKPHTN